MSRSLVAMCMGGIGHVQALLPLVSGLGARGYVVHVMTRGEYQARVEDVGARFVDLYAERSLEGADATSIPIPSRFVTFAATYAESLCREVAALDPALIVYDMFTLAGPVTARLLGIPYVNFCSNHAPVPARMIAALRRDPRVAISAECHAAVKRLQQAHGMSGASPFSYYETLSPYLNVYAEPRRVPRRRTSVPPSSRSPASARCCPGLHGPPAPPLRATGA